MRSIELYFDEDDLIFKENQVPVFKLKLKALRDNEKLKDEVLAYIKGKMDGFFNELKNYLEKSKEEEVSEG